MNRYQLTITVVSIALAVSLAILIINITSISSKNSITVTSVITKTITYTPRYVNTSSSNSSQFEYQFMLPYVIQSIPEESNGYWRSTVMFEENPQHNYVIPTRTGFFMVNVTWGVVVPPAIYGDLLLVTTSGPFNSSSSSFPLNIGSVYAINLTNGAIVWFRVFPNQIMTQPIVFNGIMIVGLGNSVLTPTYRGTGTNYLAAVNVTNGEVLWNYTTLGEDMPTPVFYRGLVIEADGSGEAFALNATTGKPLWVDELGTYDSMSSLLLVNNIVYFGTSTTFWAINATTGSVIWSDYLYGNYQNIGGLDDSSPAYYNGIVVTSFTLHNPNDTMSVMLVAFNASNGRVLWILNEGLSKITPNLEAPPVVIYDGLVIHDSPVGVLYVVNFTNGKVLWTFKTGLTLSNAVIVLKKFIVIQNRSGELFILTLNGNLVKEVYTPVVPGPGNLLATGDSLILVGVNGIVESLPLFTLLHS
ncbi:PQQ-binding-like beta-propeller repeat protein [Caldivirga sp.]|uniref:PQQ-binding-like beta-propeller repeat protein n=1 Tax=Caldivirga sp. TaxID=2080243 RepID=UPI0025BDC911|nr:PQQ-binding-like beta-propeller repeat protein [Caldivirga sp.]